MFFPTNSQAVWQCKYAEMLLAELENFTSLDRLRGNQSLGNKKDKAIKAAYKRLWDINSSDQYKGLQVLVFQIITSALKSLTP
jgi:hypothetical protein